MKMKTIEMRKERWKDLYQNTGETKVLYIISCAEGGKVEQVARPPLWPEYKQERIEWAWKDYLAGMEKVQWLEDDSIPFLSLISGTEIFAEAFGAKVYRPKDDMPFAIPFVTSPQDAEKVKIPRLEDTPLMDLFDIADELKRRGGSEALLKLPDIQSPMDVVAVMWDKADLFPSMVEAPEAVKELSEKVRTLQMEFLDTWFARYGTEYISHHPDYYMDGGITMSVDEIGSVSSHMFEEFFAQELAAFSERYGGIGIHCCANAKHQWKHLKEVPGLVMLQLSQPPSVLDESYGYFQNAAAMWPCMCDLKNKLQPRNRMRMEEYPKGSRIVITEITQTKDEAIRLAETLKEEYDKNRNLHMIPRKR